MLFKILLSNTVHNRKNFLDYCDHTLYGHSTSASTAMVHTVTTLARLGFVRMSYRKRLNQLQAVRKKKM